MFPLSARLDACNERRKDALGDPGTRSTVFTASVGVLTLCSLLLAASAPSANAYVGYPSSIVVLAHSGATGENSDPSRPGVEVRANSWATGTNPAVNSVYLRILAKNPAIKGHNVNLAHGSATVHDLVRQAQRAVALEPKPELILIQIMDADMVCPAKVSDYAAFRSTFISPLKVLAQGAPESSFFVVSQFGSPTTEGKTLSPAERKRFGGTGPCAFLDPAGRLVPKELARLEGIAHGYEAQLEAAGRRFSQCRYDGGAFGRIVNKREYVSSDLNHWSVKGHAKAASVAWPAMKRARLVPRSG
jgi:hypothetical protein